MLIMGRDANSGFAFFFLAPDKMNRRHTGYTLICKTYCVALTDMKYYLIKISLYLAPLYQYNIVPKTVVVLHQINVFFQLLMNIWLLLYLYNNNYILYLLSSSQITVDMRHIVDMTRVLGNSIKSLQNCVSWQRS